MMTEFHKQQKITDDIAIDSISLWFENPIRESVPQYSYDRWGYRHYEGTSTVFNYDDNVATVFYYMSFSGKAILRGGSILEALKNEIEKRYSVKIEERNGGAQMAAFQDNDLSFFIRINDWDDNKVIVLIAVEKDGEMLRKHLGDNWSDEE